MKKRLASLLLATAFVFAAGAAFAAAASTPTWKTTVPAGGDFVFTGKADASGDLSSSAAALTFAPVVSYDASANKSLDHFVFGVSGVVTGNNADNKGASFDKAGANHLFVRIPVASAASGTWKFRGFGNTSVDSKISFDISAANNTETTKYALTWPDLVGITSADIGYVDGDISWKVSSDVLGWMKPLQVSFDIDPQSVLASTDSASAGRSMDIAICFVKTVPAVKVTYKYDEANSGDVIVNLSADKITTITLPVARTTTAPTAMKITAIQNVGNSSFKVLAATGTALTSVAPSAEFYDANNVLYSGGKLSGAAGLTVTSGDTGVSVLDMLGGYGLTVKWTGVVTESSVDASIEAQKSVSDALTANTTLKTFEVKKQTLAFKIGGKTATFPTKVGSADFTGYSSVVASYDVSNALAATGFALAPATAVVSTDAGVLMPNFSFTVDHNKAIADGVFTATEWNAMLAKTTAADRRDAFLAKMSITFGVAGQKFDLVKFIDAAGFNRGDFIAVSVNGSDVDVAVSGFYLVDGPAADITASRAADAVTAGFKSLTVNGIPVVAFADGTTNDVFAMDALVNKSATVASTYDVTGTVKGSDGAGIQDVLVSFGALTPVSTDATGAYTFKGVADGSYTATFTKAGYQSQTKSVTVAGANVTVDPVTLVQGANLVVDLQNATGTSYTGSVTFTVTDASSDAFVASADATVATDASMALVKGDYKLAASTVTGYTVTLGTTTFTVDSADVAATATIAAVAGDSSSGGCNVGFAPLALLLLAPVMFLKK